MKSTENHLSTSVVDLFSPANRFLTAAKLHGRLHRWWLLLRKYWWIPVCVFVMVLIPTMGLILRSGPTYESKARMWIAGKINVSENWSYTEELVNFLGTQVALLESPAIQKRAMVRMRAEAGLGTVLPDGAAIRIPYQVKVLEGAKSSTLDLRVTGPDPKSARIFLDCLMAEFLSFKRESRDQTSSQASSSLSGEASELKNELAAAQEKLQAFQASNNVVLLQQQGNGAENYLATLNRQLAVLRTEQQLLQSIKPEQWLQNGGVQADAGQSPGDDAGAHQLLTSLAESQTALVQADQQMHLLTAKRDELSQFLLSAHPKIVKLNQDIATQQQIVQAAQDEAAKQLVLRREAVAAQIQNLETASAEWDNRAIAASRQVAVYDQLQQAVQRLQAAYDKTLGLIQNLDVANRVEQESLDILDPASPGKMVHRRIIDLAVAVAMASLMCFGIFYCLALFLDHFTSTTELTEQLGEPVLGQIPLLSLNPSFCISGGVDLEQRFEFLEAFRNIRASMLFMDNDGVHTKTILITSSVPGEGKSTVALYLATALAKGNSRVLLVDGDMRRPNLHHFFGRSTGPGLAELLVGQTTPADVIYSTRVENLDLLPAGRARQNPGDLMLSEVWPSLLLQLKQQYDFILIDTPPVAATDDATTLAAKADGVLFIVRALSTSARVARGTLNLLRQRRAHLVGLILNGTMSSPSESQYYQPYAHEYQWTPPSLAESVGVYADSSAAASSSSPQQKQLA